MLVNNGSGKIMIVLLALILSVEYSYVIQITTDEYRQLDPAIYGDVVVWTDLRYYGALWNSNIYICDLATKGSYQITKSGNIQHMASIYGDVIVWSGYMYSGTHASYDIYGYNLTTQEEFQITKDENDQYFPAIYGDIVVWVNDRYGNYDIYGYNLTTQEEFQITREENDQDLPAIYGDIVVWTDERNGNWDIYGYNLTTREEFQITKDENDQYGSAIYGDIVVWTDERNGNTDIYGYDFSLYYYEMWYPSNHGDRSFIDEYWWLVLSVPEIAAALILSAYFFHDYAAKKRRASLAWGFGFLIHGILSRFWIFPEIFSGQINLSGLPGVYYFIVFMPLIFGVLIAFEMTSFYYGASLLFFGKRSFFREKMSILFMVIYSALSFYFIQENIRTGSWGLGEPISPSHWVLKIPIFFLITILFYRTYLEAGSNEPSKRIFLVVFMAWLMMTINAIPLSLGIYYFGPLALITQNLEPVAWILMVYCMTIRRAAVLVWKRRIMKDTVLMWKKAKKGNHGHQLNEYEVKNS